MPTCEDRVAELLYGWFENRKSCQIVSFHPPSGKAYSSDLVRISRRSRGNRTSDRYHVDVVVVEGEFLLLLELKCRLSEAGEDVAKLRDIRDSYTVTELLELIRRRTTTSADLSGVRRLVLGVGYEIQDQEEGPEDFLTFRASTTQPLIRAGNAVPADVRAFFGA